jgi:photosystem II stability/assembly factor-like uncharacterized protein
MILPKLLVPLVIGGLVVGCTGTSPTPPSPTDANPASDSNILNPYDVTMISGQLGWALSGQGVLRTLDGGATWSNVTPPGAQVTSNTKAFFLNPETGWILEQPSGSGGPKGTLHYTRDAGKTWRRTAVPFGDAHLHFVSSGGQTFGWALVTLGGALGSSPAEVYLSEDGGQVWKLVSKSDGPQHAQPTPGALPFAGIKQGISFRLDGQVGWVGIEERQLNKVGLFRTEDKGLTWNRQNLSIPDAQRDHSVTVLSPSFTSSQEGTMVVRFHGAKGGYAVYITVDGGTTWSPGALVPSKERILASFVDSRTGWAVETDVEKAQLFMTEDGGNTWSMTNGAALSGVKGLAFTDRNHGWVMAKVEGNLKLLVTKDGGKTWVRS